MPAPRMPATLLLLLVSLQQLGAAAGKQPHILFVLSDGAYRNLPSKPTFQPEQLPVPAVHGTIPESFSAYL